MGRVGRSERGFAARLATLGVAWLGSVSGGLGQQAPDVSEVPDSAAYLLVIDHSGSMLTKDQPLGNQPTGKTRWEAMKEKAKEFVRTVPLESRLWIAVFSDKAPDVSQPPFATEEHRKTLLDRIDRDYGDPEPQARTWLYDTLGLAFEEARRLSEENAGRNISVLVYSDGEDNKSAKWTKEKLKEEFEEIAKINENLWVFVAPIGKEGMKPEDILDHEKVQPAGFQKYPLGMPLTPSEVRLKNAKTDPQQTFELEFLASDETWDLVKASALSFDFVPEDGQNIEVKVPQVPFRKGRIQLELEVMNPDELQGLQEYSGKLNVHYPVLEKHEVRAAPFIQVSFQKGQKPEIYRLIPEQGKRFPAGQSVQFKVSTLKDADVTWDFGDDQTASGHDVRHVYNTPGERTVKVSVVADPKIGATEREFTVDIVDVGVSVDPYQGPIVAGVPFRFTCSSRGEIQRYEWLAGGNRFEGHAPEEPAEHASEFTYTFDGPGPYEVTVVGYAQGAKPSSMMAVNVVPKPLIEIQGGSPCPFSKPVQFKLVSTEGWQDVAWDFGDDGKDLGNTPNPVHRYTMRGSFTVTATITWKGGHELELKEPINVVAEPPVAEPVALVGGGKVEHVTVGDTVELQDASTGDVVRRTWFHDGRRLEPGQVSLPIDEVGDHRIKLRVEGPPDRDGNVLFDEKELVFQAWPPPNHYLFVASLIGALVVAAISARFLLGNAPRAWVIHYSNRQPPDERKDPRVKVSEGWKWWRKFAEIPMSRFFKKCPYWSSGDGSKESVRITAFKSGTSWEGSVTYSGKGNSRVVISRPKKDVRTVEYKFRDNRCTDEAYKTVYLLLLKRKSDSARPLLALGGIVVVLAAALCWIYHLVYRAGF